MVKIISDVFVKDERISLKKCKIFAAFLRDYDNSNNNYWPYGNTIKEYCLAVLKNLERTLGEGLKFQWLLIWVLVYLVICIMKIV